MIHGKIFGQSPSIDLDVELKRQKQVLAAIQAGLIQSAHDVAEGGLAVAISESAIGAKGLGATVKLDGEATAALFAESQSRFVITVKRENKEAFEKAVEAIQVGEVTNTNEVTIHNEENEVLLTANVDEMRKAWKGNPMLAEIKGLNEECGVFGIWGHENAAQVSYYGLHSLQHRGQEGAGIVVNNGEKIIGHKGLGLISEVFSRGELEGLNGKSAIGHVRYATAGGSEVANVQPLLFRFSDHSMALAHNGNLINAKCFAAN